MQIYTKKAFERFQAISKLMVISVKKDVLKIVKKRNYVEVIK